MSEQAEQGPKARPASKSPEELGASPLPGIFNNKYNTIYERIMGRTTGDNPVPIVVACVVYSLYKQEKGIGWSNDRSRADAVLDKKK